MPKGLRDLLMTSVILLLSFLFGLVTDEIFETAALVPMVFVLGVFLVSVITEGYLCGVTASLISTLAVNFAFTFPYFEFNFTIPENLFSGVVMLVVAIVTCALTNKLKQQEKLKADSEREKMRANLANIRKKLGERPGERRYISNELGVGYRMISDDE